MGTMLNAALEYIKQGISVIPLKFRDKKPALKSWKEYQTRHATEEELKEWFKNDKVNIGIITGEISKLSVLDIDGPDPLKLAKSKGLPETKLIKTGKPGGWHCYYQYEPGLRNWQARTDLPGIDIRSDGGYVVAPPSIHPNGQQYKCYKDIALGLVPLWVLNNSSSFTNITNISKGSLQDSTLSSSVVNLFGEHRKDIDLFHVTNCLVKGRCEIEYIREVLKRLMNSWGEYDPKWIEDKIKSAIQRAERKEINLVEEIKDWLLSSTGVFLSSDFLKSRQLSSREDIKNVSKIFSRLCSEENPIIERYGKKNGCFRIIDRETNFITFDENSESIDYPVDLPFDLDTMVSISPKNIILVAGELNAGKTLFMLDVLRRNKGKLPIRYISSEMEAPEFIKRFRGFTKVKFSFWKPDEATEYIYQSRNFQDYIIPDRLNIIDYVEISEGEFSQVVDTLRGIHDKLSTGIAIVAIQKKKGLLLGRGGDFTLEKARLGLSLFDIGNNETVVKITKAKSPKSSNVQGMELLFRTLEHGTHMQILKDWDYHNLLKL